MTDHFWVCQNCGHEFPNPPGAEARIACPQCGQTHLISGALGQLAYKQMRDALAMDAAVFGDEPPL